MKDKISKITRSCLIVFFIFLLSACYGSWNFLYEGNNVDERTKNLKYISNSTDNDFAAADISSLSGKYTVLVFSDTHFGNKKKDVDCAELYDWLDRLKGKPDYPVFAISLGDVVDLGKQNEYDMYLKFCKKLQTEYGIKMIFNACGNHDIYQGNWDNWEKNCYPHTSFYKFKTSKFSWYCLDTASGTIGLKQYQKIHDALENDSRPKIVFTHYRFVRFNLATANMAETTERNKLISDFSKNKVKVVLGGHNHDQTEDNLGFMAYGLPSFGYGEKWGLLHVDENAGKASLEFIP